MCVPSWTKYRIMSATNRVRPAALPSLAMSSARLFSLSCRGVFSESPRSAREEKVSREFARPRRYCAALRHLPIMIRPLKDRVPTAITT